MTTPTVLPHGFDHLVYATPRLAETVEQFTATTGVRPVPGGPHPGRGTRNHLVGLGGSGYLEIIGPDPEQPAPPRPRPFGIDELTGPRVVTWAIRPDDLDATVAGARRAGYDPGDIEPMSRSTPDAGLLEWRLAPAASAHPSGLVPFLIDWGSSAHPTSTGLPTVPVVALAGQTPEPAQIRPLLAAVGTTLDLAEGPTRLEFTLDTADGPVSFS